ncbi:MAG: hypothetical protein M1818_006134 [Claussenomyces sp. TS43310]|nr:MAG: hypothetical protein M1818_006134 [Claussenomyces sp. TS43310]
MSQRMQYDNVAWDRIDAEFDVWKDKLYQEENLVAIGQFIAKHCGGSPVELFSPIAGAFNVCLRISFQDGASAMIRFPRPGSMFSAEEKVRKEVAVMRYVADKTTIPVPFIFHYGMTEDSPAGLGPFIIMEYIKHSDDINGILNTPGLERHERPILDPNISVDKLESVYSQMAGILLQLSQLSFDKIGSLEEVDKGRWAVTGRPLTFNTNELVQMANFPPQKLPSTTFSTSSDYYKALADVHLTHLSVQRNDAIKSAEDCRRRYVARHLFRQLAQESRLEAEVDTKATSLKPFRLFCDDLRPTNVLVDDECNIVGVIDWEFAYVAPAEFTYSPPWWLLIEMPEYWPAGVEDWTATYEPRLALFLKALAAKEQEMVPQLNDDERLSIRMRKYWDSGDFWINYAARKSWSVDLIFWEKLYKRFFGDDTDSDHADVDKAVAGLGKQEREDMETLVAMKLEQKETRNLDSWA